MMIGIVWARTGFRVILNTEDRLLAMGHGSHRSVIEIEMRYLNAVTRQARGIESKPVVLAGDFHLACGAARVV